MTLAATMLRTIFVDSQTRRRRERTLILLSAGSIFLINFLSSRAIVSKLTGQAVGRSLDGLDVVFRRYLYAARHQAEFVERAIRSGRQSFKDAGKLAEFAAGSLAAAPQNVGIIVADSNGTAVRARRLANETIEKRIFNLQSDPQLERLMGEARQRKGPFWGSPVYSDVFKTTLINLRVPVWKAEKYLGFAAVALSLDTLSKLALELSEPPRSNVFVLFGADKVLAHMFLASRPQQVSAEKP